MRKFLIILLVLIVFPAPVQAQNKQFEVIWEYSLANWAHMPIIHDGIVYNAWTGGKLAATDLNTGELLRTADGVASATAPFVVGDKIYSYTGGNMYELNLHTFQRLRTINIPHAHYTENIPYDDESGFFYAKQADYPNNYWGRLSAFRLSDGQRVWSFPKDYTDMYRGQTAPLVVGDYVYVFFAANGTFTKLDKFTGQEIWTADLGGGSRNGYNNPIYDHINDYFYVSESWNTIDSEVTAIRGSDGEIIWNISNPGRQIESTMTYHDNVLYLPLHNPGSNGNYKAVDVRNGGATIWDEPGFYGEDGWGVTAVSEKYLYRVTKGIHSDYHIIVQDRHTGKLVWSEPTDMDVPCTNPVTSNGIVVIGTATKLIGLKVGTGLPVDSDFHGQYATGYNPGAINDGPYIPPTPGPSPTPRPTSTPPPSPTPGNTITSNLQVNDGNLWQIFENLQQGNTQYGDRSYTFSSIPSYLLGAEWIRTANSSRDYTAGTLASFSLSSNATVYVAHDDRISPKPSWLSSWADTGDNLTNSEPQTFSLYAKDFGPGTVSIGQNSTDGAQYAMYSVIVSGGGSGPPTGDHDHDGDVDIYDYFQFLPNFPNLTILDFNFIVRYL